MPFDATAYGPEVAALLATRSDGQHLMPLVHAAPANVEIKTELDAVAARKALPEAAIAGLYLYFDYWEEAHETAQDIATPEGSYWHAIVHRQEPDAGNAGYWFRQVGAHAIFPGLRERAAAIGVDFGPRWNPTAFIDYCEKARQQPGGESERRAREVQRAEWQLLFDYCARASGTKARPA